MKRIPSGVVDFDATLASICSTVLGEKPHESQNAAFWMSVSNPRVVSDPGTTSGRSRRADPHSEGRLHSIASSRSGAQGEIRHRRVSGVRRRPRTASARGARRPATHSLSLRRLQGEPLAQLVATAAPETPISRTARRIGSSGHKIARPASAPDSRAMKQSRWGSRHGTER